MQLKLWQWLILVLPIASTLSFMGIAAGFQIHHWGINWIWAVIALIFVGWRFLLVRWLRLPSWTDPDTALLDAHSADGQSAEVNAALPAPLPQTEAATAAIQRMLISARDDVPPWEDWTQFFQRCQTLIEVIAHIYAPQAKRPFLNIYVPQAYGLLRGTIDDVDRWMQQLSPVLGQVTIGQAYEAYETYQKLEPTARLALKVMNWSQWLFNPTAALAKTATQYYRNQANQQLLVNLGQILREKTLKALGERAIALYSGEAPKALDWQDTKITATQTQTLRQIFDQATPLADVEQAPLQVLLVGRTGAGKSSLINTLFVEDKAGVDVLPSTDDLQVYTWSTPTGESLQLWDTPGYEQVGRTDFRNTVLAKAAEVDIVLLVTPALDPALNMDHEFLDAVKTTAAELPAIAIVTQVDRLRPIREWEPPYDWQQGSRPKEKAIQGAVAYRQEILGTFCKAILPLVTANSQQSRLAWGVTPLSQQLIAILDPAKQLRLARFLQDQNTRIAAAAKVIDQYALQMSTQQGLAALLKSPILNFIATMTTGSPALAQILAAKLPIEQAPVVMGKLQMAYELFAIVAAPDRHPNFDLLVLWPLLLEQSQPLSQDAWAFGHTIVEYWLGHVAVGGLRDRYQTHLADTAQSATFQV